MNELRATHYAKEENRHVFGDGEWAVQRLPYHVSHELRFDGFFRIPKTRAILGMKHVRSNYNERKGYV